MLKQRKRNVEVINYIISTFLFMVVSYFILPRVTELLDPMYFIMLEFVLLMFFIIMSIGRVAYAEGEVNGQKDAVLFED